VRNGDDYREGSVIVITIVIAILCALVIWSLVGRWLVRLVAILFLLACAGGIVFMVVAVQQWLRLQSW